MANLAERIAYRVHLVQEREKNKEKTMFALEQKNSREKYESFDEINSRIQHLDKLQSLIDEIISIKKPLSELQEALLRERGEEFSRETKHTFF